MPQPLNALHETASQTVGPFVHIGLTPWVAGIEVFHNRLGSVIAAEGVPGERIVVEGTIFDGSGAAVRDAVIETWQADAAGRYASAEGGETAPGFRGFRGFGRIASDLATGLFRIETIKPGPVQMDGGGAMAPHILVWIVARGINLGLLTRLYFADEEDANRSDPVLGRVEPARRGTLLAKPAGDSARGAYRFDIRLQGDGETVFFDV